MKAELEVGSKVYICHSGEPTSVLTIKRTTKTQAISGDYRFRKLYSIDTYGGYITEVGYRKPFSRISYRIESPELIEAFAKRKVLEKIKQVNFNKFSTETLQLVLDTLKSAT